MSEVRLPGDAIDPALNNVSAPTVALLGALNLLPSDEALNAAGGPAAAVGGPSQGVALIEAGATAVGKWWSAGLGTALAGIWVLVKAFYNSSGGENQRVLLWGAAIVSAALVLGIAFLLSADIRGRATATVATIEARAQVADTVVRAAHGSLPADAPPVPAIVALPDGRNVAYLSKPAAEENDWLAIAVMTSPGTADMKFLLVKGNEKEWANGDLVRFV